MEKVKNAPILVITLITLLTAGCIMLFPLDAVLQSMSLSDFHSEYIGLSLKMAFIFIISYWIITKTKLNSAVGLSRNYKWKFKGYNFIPVYLILLGFLSVLSLELSQIQLQDLLLLLFACLTVGFAEEFLFRGLLQAIFLRKFLAQKNGILLSVLLPAILFGLFHLINLTKNEQVMAVLVQVVFATLIGFFFGVLVLKTNKIIPVAITHGLINFSFSIALLPGLAVEQQAGFTIAPIVLTLPLLIIGLLMVRKINKEDVVNKINESFNQPKEFSYELK